MVNNYFNEKSNYRNILWFNYYENKSSDYFLIIKNLIFIFLSSLIIFSCRQTEKPNEDTKKTNIKNKSEKDKLKQLKAGSKNLNNLSSNKESLDKRFDNKVENKLKKKLDINLKINSKKQNYTNKEKLIDGPKIKLLSNSGSSSIINSNRNFNLPNRHIPNLTNSRYQKFNNNPFQNNYTSLPNSNRNFITSPNNMETINNISNRSTNQYSNNNQNIPILNINSNDSEIINSSEPIIQSNPSSEQAAIIPNPVINNPELNLMQTYPNYRLEDIQEEPQGDGNLNNNQNIANNDQVINLENINNNEEQNDNIDFVIPHSVQNIRINEEVKMTKIHCELMGIMTKYQGVKLKLSGPVQYSFFKLLNFFIRPEEVKNLREDVAAKILNNIKCIINIDKNTNIDTFEPGAIANTIILMYEEIKKEEYKKGFKKELKINEQLKIDVDRLSDAFKEQKQIRELYKEIRDVLTYKEDFLLVEENSDDDEQKKENLFILLLNRIMKFYFTLALAKHHNMNNKFPELIENNPYNANEKILEMINCISELNQLFSKRIKYHLDKGANIVNFPDISLAIELNKYISKQKEFKFKLKNMFSKIISPIKNIKFRNNDNDNIVQEDIVIEEQNNNVEQNDNINQDNNIEQNNDINQALEVNVPEIINNKKKKRSIFSFNWRKKNNENVNKMELERVEEIR